jgi:F0F1-type ATP synthase delta subunit
MENLKYLLANGQESMTIRQIADALKEANNLIEENQKLREVLDSNEYISFIRKSLTNAECRRYWKQLLNK